MTIEAKVLKAWTDSWRVVSVTEKNAEPVRGKIITFNPGDNSFCLLKDDSDERIYRIVDLIDIGFPLDEAAQAKQEGPGGDLIYEFSPDDMPESFFILSGKCQHADRCNQGKVEPEERLDDSEYIAELERQLNCMRELGCKEYIDLERIKNLKWHIDRLKTHCKKLEAGNAEMRDALKAIQNEYASNDEKSVTCVIRNEVWQQLIDAVNKADGGE